MFWEVGVGVNGELLIWKQSKGGYSVHQRVNMATSLLSAVIGLGSSIRTQMQYTAATSHGLPLDAGCCRSMLEATIISKMCERTFFY